MKIKFEIDLYFVAQKLIGILLIVLSIILVKVMDGDATHCLLFIPLGLMLFFTKHRMMDLGRLGRSECDD